MSKAVIIVVCVAAAVLALPIVARVIRPAETAPAQAQEPSSAATSTPAADPSPAPAAPAPDPTPSSTFTPTPLPQAPPGTPAIVAIDPPIGATGVSPGLREIKVNSSVPMRGGFSWTGGGPSFPGAPNQKAYWMPDHQTCVLPVALQHNSSYRLGLNSPSYKNFKSASGVPFSPVVWTFSTGN